MSKSLAALLSHLHNCSLTRNLAAAQRAHAHLITADLLRSSPRPTTSLITLYSKLNLPSHSLSAFLSLPNPPNLLHFNALIAALSSHNLHSLALRYFHLLRIERPTLSPDRFSYPCTIKACTALGLLCQLHVVHGETIKVGLDDDEFVVSALVRALLAFELVECARTVFDELRERDVVLWTAMVTGLAQKGDFLGALECFRQMGVEGVRPSSFTVTGVLSVFTAMADVFSGRVVHGLAVKAGFEEWVPVGNALIDLYGKCHEMEDVVEVFEGMQERDLVSWNSMISACLYNADHGETLRMFRRLMHTDLRPDAITLAAVLPACAQTAAFMHGREIHTYILRSGMRESTHLFVHNALMDMYAKAGTLADAKLVFERMPAHNVVSWNILIHGYASNGLGSEALELFEAMCLAKMAPDGVTFIGLLSACSHAGLVEQGRDLFRRMKEEYKVVPVMEHYSCVVDLLGRAGQLKEAQEIAEQAEGAGPWRAYLAACKMHGDTEHAVEAAERVVGLEPKGSGAYVLLANSYGLAGKFEEVEELRARMRRRRVRKVIGCSWVEVGGLGLSTFITGDEDHLETISIYGALQGLFRQMKEFGCPHDVLMQEMDQEAENALSVA